MAIERPVIINFQRTGVGGACYVTNAYPPENMKVEIYAIGIGTLGQNYQNVVLIGSGTTWVTLDFHLFMLGPAWWDIEAPCTTFAVAKDGDGNYSAPSIIAWPALINIQPITFMVGPIIRSSDRQTAYIAIGGLPDERDMTVAVWRGVNDELRLSRLHGGGTLVLTDVGGIDNLGIALFYLPYWSFTISGIMSISEMQEKSEMVQYMPQPVVRDTTTTWIVPMFNVGGGPILNIGGENLNIKMVTIEAVTDIVVGTTAVWTELGDGYYTLELDGVTYFDELGDHQINIRYTGAVSVHYLAQVVRADVNDSICYDVIRDSQGLPVPAVDVTVYEHGTTNNLYSTKTYADGQYSIPVSAIAPVHLVDIEFTPTGQPSFRRDGVWLG